MLSSNFKAWSPWGIFLEMAVYDPTCSVSVTFGIVAAVVVVCSSAGDPRNKEAVCVSISRDICDAETWIDSVLSSFPGRQGRAYMTCPKLKPTL